MLHEQLLGKWHAREYAMPIQPTMTFTPEGLVLGAGALILRAEGPRQLQSLRGREARALALLSAFHGKPTAQAVLWNIERAAKAWREGDGCLAYIHLAHAGLSRPQDLLSAAYRLEMAQCAMKCGATPRAVLKALHLDRPLHRSGRECLQSCGAACPRWEWHDKRRVDIRGRAHW